MIKYIDGVAFKDMFLSGANNLQNNKDLVNKLNVFLFEALCVKEN